MQIGQEGVSYVVSPESRIRLVDPKRMTAADRRARVTRLGRLGLRQPFEQMDLR